MNQIIIAERLISLRKNAGLSQSAVADLLSVTRQAVSKWESGKASPSLEAYSALAALYKTSIEAIITGEPYEGECDLVAVDGTFFAERLKNLRILRKLSQGEVSEALSVSRQSVSKWERGEAEPDAERLIALSQLFSVPLAILLPYTKKELVIVPDEIPEAVEETPVTIEEVTEEVTETTEETAVVTEETTAITEEITEEVEETTEEVEETTEEVEETTEEVEETAEETPTVTKKQDAPTKKRYRDMLLRAAAIRKKKKAEEKASGAEEDAAFRTVSDVGPNDPAYVYVSEDDKKIRTALPLLAAIPIAAATLALIFRKKK